MYWYGGIYGPQGLLCTGMVESMVLRVCSFIVLQSITEGRQEQQNYILTMATATHTDIFTTLLHTGKSPPIETTV
jgi:hypothetical protein